MGGDGGTITCNRRYLRGAGSANHTADRTRRNHRKNHDDDNQSCLETMRHCSLTGVPLFDATTSGGGKTTTNNDIVACPYGRMYIREAAIEALLRRKRNKNNHFDEEEEEEEPEIGWHVRGLKDLHPVRFHFEKNGKNVPLCPITNIEFNGSQPAYLIVKSDKKSNEDDGPNVLSDRAIKEMGLSSLQAEFGPFNKEDMIRLAPPSRDWDDIKRALEEKRREAGGGKKKKKKKRKKMTDDNNREMVKKTKSLPMSGAVAAGSREGDAVELAKNRVEEAVKSNSVLSSLFVKNKAISEKEKKDNLFARC